MPAGYLLIVFVTAFCLMTDCLQIPVYAGMARGSCSAGTKRSWAAFSAHGNRVYCVWRSVEDRGMVLLLEVTDQWGFKEIDRYDQSI